MEDRLLDVTEAASLLSVSKATMWRLARDGKIAVTKVGHKTLFKKSVVHEFIEQNTTPAAS